MIVDPSTGLPIEEGRPAATRFSGSVAMDAMDNMGLSNQSAPLFYDLAASLPSATHTTLWNMGRTSNTLLSGGVMNRRTPLTGRLPGNPGEGGFFRQGISQTVRPSRYRRMTRAANIDPVNNDRMYSPFGFASRAGNFGLRQASKTQMGRDLTARLTGGVGAQTDAFSRGTFGRMTAMARVGDMNASRFGRAANSLGTTLDDLRPGVGTAFRGATSGGLVSNFNSALPTFQRGAAQGAIGSTINGSISGRVAGFYQGAQAARVGSAAQTAGLRAMSGEGFFAKGVASGLESYGARGGQGALARIAGSRGASLGLRAAGPIGWALLARDFATMGGKLMARGAKTVMEAGHSLAAPLNKDVMGGAYRDNAVAATARQRGVMAIANSRLNARSVLGNEAAGLAAHFG